MQATTGPISDDDAKSIVAVVDKILAVAIDALGFLAAQKDQFGLLGTVVKTILGTVAAADGIALKLIAIFPVRRVTSRSPHNLTNM